MRKKKRAIHKYNQKLAAEEDAAYAAEEEARLATASAGLRDFIDKHRVGDAPAGLPHASYKKRDGEKEWQDIFTKITKTILLDISLI